MPSIPETPTLFYYSGAEDLRFGDMLISTGVKRVVMSYGTLKNMTDKRVGFMFAKLCGNGCEVLVDPAIGPMTKQILEADDPHITRDVYARLGEYVTNYIAWLGKWKDYITVALNCDFDPVFIRPKAFGYDDIQVEYADGTLNKIRDVVVEEWDRQLLDTGVPIIKVWHQHQELKDVAFLREFKAISLRNINSKATLRMLMNQAEHLGIPIHAIGMNRVEWLERMGFYSASNASWLTGKQFGQTYVFDGRSLTAYHKDQQQECRKRHYDHFKHLGLDAEKIRLNDGDEVCRANLRAWVDFEKFLQRTSVGAIIEPPKAMKPTALPAPLVFGDDEDVWNDAPAPRAQREAPDENERLKVVSQQPNPDDTDTFATPEFKEQPSTIDMISAKSGDVLPAKAEPRTEPIVIPSHRSQVMQGNDYAIKNPSPNRASSYLKDFPVQCDNCFASKKCPKFTPGALCAYRKEFESLDTRDVHSALDELGDLAKAQKSRVIRALMYENVANGGMIAKDVGMEIDRMQKLLESITRIRKEMQTVTVGISKDGILAQFFGEGVIDPKRLDGEAPAEFIDVQVVDE